MTIKLHHDLTERILIISLRAELREIEKEYVSEDIVNALKFEYEKQERESGQEVCTLSQNEDM